MRGADRIAGAGLLVLAVSFSAGALTHYAYWSPNGPGPAFLPFWLGVVMAVLALLLLVGALRERDPGEDWLPRGEGLRRLAWVLGITIALVASLNIVGMIIGTVIFLVVLMRVLDRRIRVARAEDPLTCEVDLEHDEQHVERVQVAQDRACYPADTGHGS